LCDVTTCDVTMRWHPCDGTHAMHQCFADGTTLTKRRGIKQTPTMAARVARSRSEAERSGRAVSSRDSHLVSIFAKTPHDVPSVKARLASGRGEIVAQSGLELLGARSVFSDRASRLTRVPIRRIKPLDARILVYSPREAQWSGPIVGSGRSEDRRCGPFWTCRSDLRCGV